MHFVRFIHFNLLPPITMYFPGYKGLCQLIQCWIWTAFRQRTDRASPTVPPELIPNAVRTFSGFGDVDHDGDYAAPRASRSGARDRNHVDTHVEEPVHAGERHIVERSHGQFAPPHDSGHDAVQRKPRLTHLHLLR